MKINAALELQHSDSDQENNHSPSFWTVNATVNIWSVSNQVDYDNHPLYE